MAHLFEDIFAIIKANKDDENKHYKPFDRVSRIFCESESFKMKLILDVHDPSYPVKEGEKFRFVLLKNLLNDNHMDNDDDFNTVYDDDTEETEESNLIDCDYCTGGKIYKIIPAVKNEVETYSVYVSFGGLLMMLEGASVNFSGFKVGQNIFAKMKRIAF